MRHLKKFAVVLAIGLLAAGAAQEFPEHEVTMLVNYGEGGGVDRTARSLQRFLPEALGQSVIVENFGGAAGKVGLQRYMNEVERDGYTVLTAFAPATTLVKFDDPSVFSLDELAIINMQWSDPGILVAHKNTGWETLDDMIEAVRADPGGYAFGSSGRGSVGPVLANVLFEELDLDVRIVPYSGGGDTRRALQAGEVQMTAAGAGGALAIQDDVVVLGAFWSDDVAGWPEARPINPMLEKYGVSVPEGGAYRFHAVHADVREEYPERYQTLVDAFEAATTSDEFQQYADETGVGAEWLGPEESTDLIRSVDERFTEIFEDMYR